MMNAINNNGKKTSGIHPTYWLNKNNSLHYKKLEASIDSDVVIVGGGVAGISLAHAFLKRNYGVILIEDGYICSGETGRTSAHLASALDDGLQNLEKLFGEEITKLAIESHQKAIDTIEKICIEENISCGFKRVPAYLFPHPNNTQFDFEKELAAAKRAGLEAEIVNMVPGLQMPIQKGIRFDKQALFEPIHYVHALCDNITKRGGLIYTETKAQDITETGIITETGYEIRAKHVVIASNAPFVSKYLLPLKQFPYRSYIIGAKIKKDILPDALWWDTGDTSADNEKPPYHYVRKVPYNNTHDLLICGGEDHETGLSEKQHIKEDERYALLEAWARSHFPIEDIVYTWSGQLMEPIDSLAYIGKYPTSTNKNVYIVTGDSGHGLTHATIAAQLIPDIIDGKQNPWETVYNPHRKQAIKKGWEWIKEVGSSMIEYLKTKAVDNDISAIAEEEGQVITLEGKKYGVYRDKHSQLHLVSAVCTHLGCIVKWNNDEKTWDCPCHGSRFSHTGEVINGPANTKLSYYRDNG